MKSNKYLRDIEFNGLISTFYNYYDSPENNEVIQVTFQITEDCNLNCSYCYQHNKTKKKMDFETAKNFIDLLLEKPEKLNNYLNLEKKRGVILDFIGGEPLLEIDLIEQITNYFILRLIELNHRWLTTYRVSITSNGMLYFSDKVQKFLKQHQNHTSMHITLDGNEQLHDMCRRDHNNNPTYKIIEKAVLHYKNNYNDKLSTKLTISPENISFLFDGVKNFIDLGFTIIHFNPVYEDVWEEKHSTEYYYQLKKIINYLIDNDLYDKIFISTIDNTIYGQPIPDEDNMNYCGGTGHMLATNSSGKIYPCLRYMESSIGNDREPYIIGNVKEGTGITDNEKTKIEILKKVTRKSQSTEKCLNCKIATGCGWCSGYNYELYGTPNKRATFICQMHQARIMAIKYYNNLLLKKGYDINKYELNIPKDWALQIIPLKEYQLLIQEE